MKIVYIAHPIRGAVRSNISRVEKILEAIMLKRGSIWPIAPYLDSCKYLNDSDTRDRTEGFKFNKRHFDCGLIDQIWVYGDSPGVRTEIQWATEKGIDVLFKDFDQLVNG